MILVDTSIWVDHLRTGVPQLKAALQAGEVVIHPWVIGELACGDAVLGFASGLWPLASGLRPTASTRPTPTTPRVAAGFRAAVAPTRLAV